MKRNIIIFQSIYAVLIAAVISSYIFFFKPGVLLEITNISVIFILISITLLFNTVLFSNYFKQKNPMTAPVGSVLTSISILYFILQIILIWIAGNIINITFPIYLTINLILAFLTVILSGICLIGSQAIAQSHFKTKTQLSNILYFIEEVEHIKVKTLNMPRETKTVLRPRLDNIGISIKSSKPTSIGDMAQYDLKIKELLLKLNGFADDINIAVKEKHNTDQLTDEFKQKASELMAVIQERKNVLSEISVTKR